MILDTFLREVVVLLASAVVVVSVCVRLRVPPIVGLLGTGVLIGPHGFAWISGLDEVELFAEVGVALLLFAIGLEVSGERLRRLRRDLLLGGSVQAASTTVVVALAAIALGLPLARATFLGFVVTLSSTALVLKLLADRREGDTPHGRVALAILLFQDFLIVPMIALTPMLAGTENLSALDVFARVGGAMGSLLVAFLAGRWVLPRLLETMVRSRVREVALLGALSLCLGMGWLAHSFGFSMALGAFLAGVMLSDSLYSHQVIADLGPFRDLFTGIFFISIGMLLDLSWVAARPSTVLLVTLGLMAVKLATGSLAARVLGYPPRTVVLVAMSLAQIGEFSFVLMKVGLDHGLLDGGRFQMLLASSVLTLVATPALVAVSGRTAVALAKILPSAQPEPAIASAVSEKSGHVIVVGFGVGGRLLAKVLRAAGIAYVVIEASGELVRSARRDGEPILYGDAIRDEILLHAGIERASVVVLAISDATAAKSAVAAARRLAPGVEIIVRIRLVREIEELRSHGADQVVAEEFETAIELFTLVLERYHVPRNVVRAQTRVLRGEGYQMLRAPQVGGQVSQAVLDALAEGTTDVYMLDSDSQLARRSLRDLDLRKQTGASVIAVVRGGTSQLNPEPDLGLEAGDCLVLVGSHGEIDRAFELLERIGRGEAQERSQEA